MSEFTVRAPGLYYAMGDGVETAAAIYVLNPDHPSHQDNMNRMTPLQRAILEAYLLEVQRTLRIAKNKAEGLTA